MNARPTPVQLTDVDDRVDSLMIQDDVSQAELLDLIYLYYSVVGYPVFYRVYDLEKNLNETERIRIFGEYFSDCWRTTISTFPEAQHIGRDQFRKFLIRLHRFKWMPSGTTQVRMARAKLEAMIEQIKSVHDSVHPIRFMIEGGAAGDSRPQGKLTIVPG